MKRQVAIATVTEYYRISLTQYFRISLSRSTHQKQRAKEQITVATVIDVDEKGYHFCKCKMRIKYI